MRKFIFITVVFSLIFSGSAQVFSQGKRSLSGFEDDKYVLIEGGSFMMGSPDTEAWREPDEILHEVTVHSFFMSKYEVSQEEYAGVMGSNPSSFKGENLPVESVSWYDAVYFCNALSLEQDLQPVYSISGKKVSWNRSADGYRLPTEAEWEYACRAGTITPFNTGDNISVDDSNYFGTYPYTIEDHYFSQNEMDTSPGVYREKTVEIDKFKPSRWGLYNMHGNVSEWCWDVYGEYNTNDLNNPAGPDSGFLRVCRGGGWNDFGKHLRSAYRAATPANDAFFSRGVRLVRNAE